MKRGHRSHDTGEIFSLLVFKSWLLTYAVKIGETGEITPKGIFYFYNLCAFIAVLL